MASLMNTLKNKIKVKIYAPHNNRIYRQFKGKKFTLLDIGCSGSSVKILKNIFPHIEYHGVDYLNPLVTEEVIDQMDQFYEINLETLDFSAIPDEYFDCLVMAHVIEHLHNSKEVISKLLPKIKPNGFLFIEYPGESALKIPSAKGKRFIKGTLSFYDDPTHVQVYKVEEIANVVAANNEFKILKSGVRRNPYFIALSPFILTFRFIANRGYVKGSDLYDFTKFASVVYAQKTAD